jgi:lysophospholipid acyltransferase (LPLAT)-like uncharacterized protein
MKRIIKRLVKSNFLQNILSRFVYIYLLFVYKTTRWTFIGFDAVDEHIHNHKPLLVCFWHGRLAMLPFAWRWNKNFYMLLSEHSDGRFISRILTHHGIFSVFGSSTRGGVKAAVACAHHLKNGGCVGITPDGPKGPREHVTQGVLSIAKLGNAIIVPATYSLSRSKRLHTWDRFVFPYPFGRGVYSAGTPFEYDFNACSLDNAKQHIQNELIRINTEADQLMSSNKSPESDR